MTLGTPFLPAVIALIALAAYFVGNINPAILIGRAYGVDVRTEGSGNAGTTNALRTIGKKAGAWVFIIDVLKGVLCALPTTLFLSPLVGLVCGLAVVVGHMWPVIFSFKGGKGVATTFGVLLCIKWPLALILIGIVIVVVAVTRMVSAGVCIAAILATPIMYLLTANANISILTGKTAIDDTAANTSIFVYTIWMLIIAALVIVKHRKNIKRIFKGEENKLFAGS